MSELGSWLAIAWTQFILVFYALGCIGLGSLLMRVLARKTWRMAGQAALTVTVIYFLLGMGVLANLWIIIGLLGWLSPWLVAMLIALFIAASLNPIVALAKRLLADLRIGIEKLKQDEWVWKTIVLLTILLIVVVGISSLRPPRGDAVAFYMPISRVIASSQRLVPLPGWDVFSQIGLSGELHFAALIMLGSVATAKEFVWLIGLAMALMVAAAGARAGLGRRGQWIVTIMVLTSSAVTRIILDGKVDLFAASLGAAGIYWAIRWTGNKDRHPIRLAGLFSGMAVIAKLSYALALIPAILVLVLWRSLTSRAHDAPKRMVWISSAGAVLRMACWMGLAALPHMLKNGIQFGQPLAPFISSTGGAILVQEWFPPEVTRFIVLTYPLALVLGSYSSQGGNLSPLLLAFAPLALLLPRPRRFLSSTLVQLTLAALVGVFTWLVFRPSVFAPRYILALLLLCIPMLAKGAEIVLQDNKRTRLLRVGVLTCLLAVLSFRTATAATHAHDAIRFMAGVFGPCEFESSNCQALNSLSHQADAGDRIFLGEFYRDWLRADQLQCASTGEEMRALLDSSTPDEAWRYLFERGFKYVAVNLGSHAFINEALDFNSIPEWIDASVLSDNGFRVIMLDTNDPTRKPAMECRQVDPPGWQLVSVD